MGITKTVHYKTPIIERRELGSKPRHHFDQNPQARDPYVPCQGDRCQLGAHAVWGDVPLKSADGSPLLRDVTEEIDLTPRSPWVYGGVAGLIGAAVGAVVGALASTSLGLSTGLSAGLFAATLGGVAGMSGALWVQDDKVKMVWDTHDITDREMVGYQELVGPGESGGETGYFHRFVADVEDTVIGTYQTPRAVHYKEEAE